MEKGWLSVGLPILAQLRWASVGPLFHIGCGPTMYCRLLPNGQYDIGSTYAQCICFGWDMNPDVLNTRSDAEMLK